MDIDEIIPILSESLERPYQPHRTSKAPKAPNGFDKELQRICNNRQQRNVWLDVGFQAWFAYFLAEPRAQAGLNSLSDPDCQAVARHICSIKPDPTVEALFQHIFYHAFRAVERRALMDQAGYRYPARQNAVPSGRASPASTASLQMQNPGETHPENQQTDAETEQPAPTIGLAHPNSASFPSQANNASPGIRLPPLLNSLHRGIGLPPLGEHSQRTRTLPLVDDHQSVSGMPDRSPSWASPNAKNIRLLFSQRMCTSVVKTNRVAAIRAFLTDTQSGCSIEIDVYSSDIPFIARELFAMEFEMVDKSLITRSRSGACMSFKEVTLRGADRQAAEKLLGAVFTILSADGQYTEELEEGRPLTDLISLTIHGNAGDSSCLKLQGTAQTISNISSRLWPSFLQS